MEFSTELSLKEFKQVRYALWLENKKRMWVHRISLAFVSAWVIIPFIQVMLLGMSRRVSFWTVCRTYPSFFIAKGWGSLSFFAMLILCIITIPQIIYWTSNAKKYEQFQKQTNIKKMVFSDIRFCGYGMDNILYMAQPYGSIKKILWIEDMAIITVNTGQHYPILLKDMEESQQEGFVTYLQSMQKTSIEITKELEYSFEDVVWQKDSQLTPEDVEQLLAMYHSVIRSKGWKLLVMAGVFGILSLIGVFRFLCLALMVVCIGYGARILLPHNEKRNVKKILKKMPNYIEFLSGTTVLADKGLYRHQKQYYNFFEWSKLTHTIIGSAGVLIMQKNSMAGFIPRKSFENDAEFLHYAHWIEEQIQKNKPTKLVPLAQKR